LQLIGYCEGNRAEVQKCPERHRGKYPQNRKGLPPHRIFGVWKNYYADIFIENFKVIFILILAL
jgi:hypothetical protein